MCNENEGLEEKVAKLLYDHWDPIGLKRLGVKNQYRRYAVELVQNFREDPSEVEILEYLKGAYHYIFGREAKDWERTIIAAGMVCQLLKGPK